MVTHGLSNLFYLLHLFTKLKKKIFFISFFFLPDWDNLKSIMAYLRTTLTISDSPRHTSGPFSRPPILHGTSQDNSGGFPIIRDTRQNQHCILGYLVSIAPSAFWNSTASSVLGNSNASSALEQAMHLLLFGTVMLLLTFFLFMHLTVSLSPWFAQTVGHVGEFVFILI